MTTKTQIRTSPFTQNVGPASSRSTEPVYPRGVGALAATCGGLFGGRTRADRTVIERLSGGPRYSVRSEYRKAA